MEKNLNKNQSVYVIATVYDNITYYYHRKGGFKWNVWGAGPAVYKTIQGVTRKARKLSNNLFGVEIGNILILQGVDGMPLSEYKVVETYERNKKSAI